MFTEIKELLKKISEFFEKKIPDARLSNDADGRTWFLKHIDYGDKLILEDLRKITDRKELNETFSSRYDTKKPKPRKGISAVKAEISMLYGFQKCFVQRYKGRVHFYRDDLSQKGSRTMHTAGAAHGLFEEFKKNLDA